MSITIPDIIGKKRDGNELSKAEMAFFVEAVTKGTIQESQIGAMLMAIYLKGLSDAETIELTRCMTFSGDTLKFPPEWEPLLIDKHSTGGVGDKISLVLAPALAALGFKVPMVSGRGLGFTGGTLDKLESLPGFKTQLNNSEMTRCLEKAGCFIGGAGAALAPADGVLYKQRDITGTVGCLPLITSSILSKKVAEGTKALVMDVKVGRGTFMTNEEDATKLAKMLVSISAGLDVKTKAVLSSMDHPIGRKIGNALEVDEALDCLKNKGPKDVIDLVATLGGVLLESKGVVKNLFEGQQKILETLSTGKALEKFKQMIKEQGVPNDFAEGYCKGDPKFALKSAPFQTKLSVKKSGFIVDMNAKDIAICCWHLGAGRTKASDPVDHKVGIELLKVVGDEVKIGTSWVVVHHNGEKIPEDLLKLLESSISITESPPQQINKILKIV